MGLSSEFRTTITQRSGSTDTRLRGLWLAATWMGWSILTLLSMIGFIASIREYLVKAQTFCQPGSCVAGQPTPESAQTLRQLGLTVGVYAGLGVGLVVISGLVSCAVAAVIVWRRPRDWMALLVSSTLITQGLYENNYLQSIFNDPSSRWYVAGLFLSYISPVQILFLCALFPNGRFVPRWMGWLLAVICLMDLPPSFFPSMPYGGLIETLFVFSGFPLITGSLIYRFRRVSTPLERQQTKWVVFGGALAIAAFLLWFTPQIILYSSLSQPGSVYDLMGHPLLLVSFLCVPLCMGVAVLRYHLWDIDVIINKALVYSILTTILALLYVGMVLGMQALLRGLLQQTNTIALIVSTLAIAALFQPARRRVQAVIDRRFYRWRYDAQKTLATFSATSRNEVELTTLSEHLVAAVQQSMQPAHVSLWLRVDKQARTGSRQMERTTPAEGAETGPPIR
jgi:hypothetical protein